MEIFPRVCTLQTLQELRGVGKVCKATREHVCTALKKTQTSLKGPTLQLLPLYRHFGVLLLPLSLILLYVSSTMSSCISLIAFRQCQRIWVFGC